MIYRSAAEAVNHITLLLGMRGEHHDRYRAKLRIALHGLQNVVAAHSRHHDVEQHGPNSTRILAELDKSRFSRFRLQSVQPHPLEPTHGQQAVGPVVVHNEDTPQWQQR